MHKNNFIYLYIFIYLYFYKCKIKTYLIGLDIMKVQVKETHFHILQLVPNFVMQSL